MRPTRPTSWPRPSSFPASTRSASSPVPPPCSTASRRSGTGSTVTATEVRAAATALDDAPASYFLGWDHLELWVGNARQAAQFLSSAFGFAITAYAGPETGVADRASYVLEQGAIRFVVTGALSPASPIAAHVLAHGDGVHDLAITVTDARAAYEAALARGARSVRGPG